MRNFAKIFAAVTTAALLCGCNGKSSEVDGTAISAEITPKTMSAAEKITETEKQTEISGNTAAADSESVTEYGEYEYQPPREVLDAHFYSDNVEAVIECIPILDDKFRDVFNDREAIDGIYKAVTEVIPQEIADNIYSNIQTYEEYDSSEFRIKNVSYMKYDFNSDGTDDYYLYVDITDEIMSAMSNFHFTRVFCF